MRLVVYNVFQIHRFVNYLFGSSTIVQENRMTQIATCDPALILSAYSMQLASSSYKMIISTEAI